MHPLDVIPASRTSSPYSLNDALGDLATNTAGTDTASLNQSLDTLSETLDRIAPQLGPTFDSLSRLSQSLNSRNQTLGDLFQSAADVSGILRAQQSGEHADPQRQRSRRRPQRPADGHRQPARERHHRGRPATQGPGRRQREAAGPTLDKVNDVTAVLEEQETIERALPGFVVPADPG